MKIKNVYHVIGLMSGTSLDGVDIAYCRFNFNGINWKYKILKAVTIPYKEDWKKKLKQLNNSDALTFVKTHADLGKYFGTVVKNFISKNKLTPDLICSHGHTIFHQPEKGFTSQIGDGAQIAAATGIETVCDFRSMDVALGGQGAPLVPVGDQLLFTEYDFCLNLGGIANISFLKNKQRIAFDICPVNMALNNLTSEINLNFDKNGMLASKGELNKQLLDKLNNIAFYKKPFPKSIGKEWYLKNFDRLISDRTVPINDRLRTVCEHIAMQISAAIKNENKKEKKLLITGGGTHNTFLISCITEQLKNNPLAEKIKIEIPAKDEIDFKEALIFAFLGVLRIRNEINVLRSVTGAVKNNIGGTVYARQ